MAAAIVAQPLTAPVAPLPTQTPAPLASLYVGDLHQNVTEEILKDFFKNFSGITSVKVCRDSMTGRSLGYAYVNFLQTEEAENAMESLRFQALLGRPVRISWSNRDPYIRKSGVGNVFVKNLSDSVDNAKLHEMFCKFGKIISCKVAMEDGKSKGHGFVQFDSGESAKEAIEKLNGQTLEGKEIFVGNFVRKTERTAAALERNFTNLYIKNLDDGISEEDLMNTFSEVGKIFNVAIMRDQNGTSRGFGFINFENHEDAVTAIEKFNGSMLGSKTLYVGRAQKKGERRQLLKEEYLQKRQERILKYQKANLYVKNLQDSVDEDALRELFGRYGTITSAVIMRDDKAKGSDNVGKAVSKGFGFVCFSTAEEANDALANLNGYLFHGKPLYVNHAQPKEVRAARLAAQFAAQAIPAMSAASASVVPAHYHPAFFYAPASGIVPPMAQGQNIMYQPQLNVRSQGWRPNAGLGAPRRQAYQPPLPVAMNSPRSRQYRPRMNGQVFHHPGQPMSYMTLQQRQIPPATYDAVAHQPGRYMQNGRARNINVPTTLVPTMENGSEHLSNGALNSPTVMLSSRLVNATADDQKQILGNNIFPLVFQQRPDLARKITGMLLEMDNSELLLLLESPEALATKVNEAIQVLRMAGNDAPETPENGEVGQ